MIELSIHGSVDCDLPGGVEVAQARVEFEVQASDGKFRSISSVIEREVWNDWSQERRREYVLAALRSALANLEIGEVP